MMSNSVIERAGYRWLDRRAERKASRSAPPSHAPQFFHQSLPGYQPSPLREAPLLAQRLGVERFWIKDESERLGLPAFKILGASWATRAALYERLGLSTQEHETLEAVAAHVQGTQLTLVAATDGNHGRAVARMAHLLGLKARIYLPAHSARARFEAIASEGAQVVAVDGSYDEAVALAAESADEQNVVVSDTSWPGYESIPRAVIAGYATIFWELEEELSRKEERGPDLVVVQMGVGALAAAVIRHYRRPEASPDVRLLGVEPERADCILRSLQAGELTALPGLQDSIMAGLNAGSPSLVAWDDLAHGLDAAIAVDDAYARAAMKALAQEGIVAGETGAAGVAGLLALLEGPDARDGREVLGLTERSRILTLVTEGATDPESYARIIGSSVSP